MHLAMILGVLLLGSSASALAVTVGEAAPPLTAQDQLGDWHRLEQLRGKVVYVDFWASWCTPCRKSMPMLDRLQQRWPEELVVLGVNVDATRADALNFLKATPVKFPIVFDPQGHWAEQFAVPGMPAGFLIDRTGVVRHVHVGYRASELPALETVIKNALEAGS